MEKEALLKEWTNVLFSKLDDIDEDGDEISIYMEVLESVYDVGFEAGKDAVKLEKQLGAPKMNKPD